MRATFYVPGKRGTGPKLTVSEDNASALLYQIGYRKGSSLPVGRMSARTMLNLISMNDPRNAPVTPGPKKRGRPSAQEKKEKLMRRGRIVGQVRGYFIQLRRIAEEALKAVDPETGIAFVAWD